ncbi:MAG: FkbM family methyltransferase [Acidiferrobacterales bacterium]
MNLRNDLKIWWRSGSWDFAWTRAHSVRPEDAHVYTWEDIPIHYRPGTTDKGAIYTVLVLPDSKAEYRVPADIEANVILDIGGHIGVAAAYLAHRFPKAKIYSFEPFSDNFALLQRNTASLANVQALAYGLSSKTGTFDIYPSQDPRNVGNYSLFTLAGDGLNAVGDPSRPTMADIRAVPDAFAELGIDRVDLIKIDTEGAEYDILTSMDRSVLSNVSWIMGELHGNRDFELLAYLSEWFDLEVHKKMESHLFLFNARNKSLKDRARETSSE